MKWEEIPDWLNKGPVQVHGLKPAFKPTDTQIRAEMKRMNNIYEYGNAIFFTIPLVRENGEETGARIDVAVAPIDRGGKLHPEWYPTLKVPGSWM